MCRYISKSVSGHQPCKTRIINDRWMELNDDSVRPCQPPSRTIKQFLLTTLYIDLNQRKPCHLKRLDNCSHANHRHQRAVFRQPSQVREFAEFESSLPIPWSDSSF